MAYRVARERTRLSRQSRTIPIRGNRDRGDGEDYGKWFRCWNCGFICSADRDELGDESTSAGDDQLEYATPTYGYEDDSAACLGDCINNYHVALELEPDGTTAKGVLHSFESNVTGGCPMCGSKNWRGDYP